MCFFPPTHPRRAAQIDLDIRDLDADYYVGTCHKWLFSCKGVAFIVVRQELQRGISPLVVPYGPAVAWVGVGWGTRGQGEGWQTGKRGRGCQMWLAVIGFVFAFRCRRGIHRVDWKSHDYHHCRVQAGL